MYQALCWVLVGGAGFKKTVRVSLHGAEVLLEETEDHGTIQQVGLRGSQTSLSPFYR